MDRHKMQYTHNEDTWRHGFKKDTKQRCVVSRHSVACGTTIASSKLREAIWHYLPVYHHRLFGTTDIPYRAHSIPNLGTRVTTDLWVAKVNQATMNLLERGGV